MDPEFARSVATIAIAMGSGLFAGFGAGTLFALSLCGCELCYCLGNAYVPIQTWLPDYDSEYPANFQHQMQFSGSQQ